MRQSLSERLPSSTSNFARARATGIAAALIAGLAPAVAALVDQLALRTLADHATQSYAQHGKDVAPSLLYGLLYAVAAVNTLLWLWVLRSARAGSNWALPLTTAVTVLGLGLALVLLGSQEYGEPIFPPVWGLLALLSPAAGALALVQLARRRTS